MLEVGNGKLTRNQNRSHFALWCMMCAPLILGNDLRSISDEVLNIVTNKNLIAVNQDALGVQAKRISKGVVDTLVKPLSDGSVAVCLFNKGGKKKRKIDINRIASDEYSGLEKKSSYEVKNLWTDERFTSDGVLRVGIDKHDCAVFIIK